MGQLDEPNIERDTGYAGRLRTRAKKVKNHPIEKGVEMQAHHLISCTAVEKSGLGDLLIKAGYNINDWPNLVFLPSTLQGACHLKVQVHRGDHTASHKDSDKDHLPSYHKMIKKRIKDLKLLLDEECKGNNKEKNDRIIKKLNVVSKSIAALIQRKPEVARLSNLYDHFQIGEVIGCANLKSIPKDIENFSFSKCKAERHHYNDSSIGPIPYQLIPGQ